jgi:hypothetical protein
VGKYSRRTYVRFSDRSVADNDVHGSGGLKTLNGRGRKATSIAKSAKSEGLATVNMICPHHGTKEFWMEGRGYYRCKRCRSAAVARRRRKVKMILVSEAGGSCCICGYARSMRALHFHHLDPSGKRLEINAKGVALSLEKLRAEAEKCVLLCSNCHAEVEDGMASVPVRDRVGTLRRSARSGVTQLAECSAVNRDVVGSSPTPRASELAPTEAGGHSLRSHPRIDQHPRFDRP